MSADDDFSHLVVDVETTMKCPVGNNKANPHWPENQIVRIGAQENGLRIRIGECPPAGWVAPEPHTHCFIGHNIGFDIQHMMQAGLFRDSPLHRHSVWDTQLAEYLLTAQQQVFPSLDYCAAKRGGTLKDSRVKDMFAAGMGADAIPVDTLDEYLQADVKNTHLVFLSQWQEAEERGMLPLLLSQMEARQATIEMEWNGLAVDKPFLVAGIHTLADQLDKLRRDMQVYTDTVVSELPPGFLDPTAPKQLATILFGGTVKMQKTQIVGTYKNGKTKTKKVDVDVRVNGVGFQPHPHWLGKDGKPLTNDNVLKELHTPVPGRPSLSGPAKFLEQVQEYRELSKQLSTYYDGLDKLVMPDGRIHHHLNHCVTVTGRLSSSEPNLQNVTNGDIKKAFVSRWGDDGVVLEADYKQLEMVMLAVLTQDKQLLHDIQHGIDMHDALFEDMHGRRMRPDERKPFKRCSFALVYGAGAPGIAEQGGCSIPEAKKFIKTFYGRYPGVKNWHDGVYQHVELNRSYYGLIDKENGVPVGESTTSSWSGRRYHFREYVNSEQVKQWKKKDTSFSPTETKNYFVQGGATGDIVPLVLGKLYRVLKNNPRLRDKCLLINTVHDSVLFDCHKSVLDEALRVIQTTMENAPKYIKDTFSFDFPLELKVGLSYGPTWFDQQEVDTSTLQLKEAA